MDPIKIEKMLAMNNYKKNQFLNHLFFHTFIAMTCSLFCTSHLWFPSLYSSMNVFFFVSLPNIRALIFNPKCLFMVCNIIVVILIGESKIVGSKTSPATEIYEEYVTRSRNLHRQRIPITPPELVIKKNVNVVILIGESKIVGSKTSPATEIYEEYVTRSRNLHRQRIPITPPELVIKKNVTKLELSMINEESDKKYWAVVEKVEEKEKVKEVIEEEESVEVVEEKEPVVEVVEDDEEEFGLPAEELNKRVEDFIERMNRHRRFEAGILVCSKA